MSSGARDGSTLTVTATDGGAARAVTVSVAGGGDAAVPDTSTTYGPATGQVATTTAGGHTITQVYDTLGRRISYNDGAGNTVTTAYDALDRPAKTTDSAPSTTTYTYDTSLDPRGLETSRSDSVAGTFSATYDADSNLATEALPGGCTMTTTTDETGADTSRTCTRDGMTVAEDAAADTVDGQQAARISGTAEQAYACDAAGRLTGVDTPKPTPPATARTASTTTPTAPV
ncbi:VCBS domain-containing protein [Streptomyces sp. NBC_01476]|uniref:VCBS domain-containing protein n=1 Tax=Streptomyces sp. NBC_01476 TaxID=2903881 RepID=UPI002E36220F|nr:VCBS domain-containing protein [Streptomyces sp. NBC_01476]